VQEVTRLLAAGTDPNVEDLDGDTPLHIAAEQCRADLAELLLRHGADPNVRNNEGKTPADLANCARSQEATRRRRWAVAAGARPRVEFRRELDLL
jgi:ankyrin repeat protein